jgi:hypothetical protein
MQTRECFNTIYDLTSHKYWLCLLKNVIKFFIVYVLPSQQQPQGQLQKQHEADIRSA